MITGSILLVLAAAGLFIAGLIRGSELLYYASIVASALAALALIVGVRQLPAARMPEEDFDLGVTRSPRPMGRVAIPSQTAAGADPSAGNYAAAADGSDPPGGNASLGGNSGNGGNARNGVIGGNAPLAGTASGVDDPFGVEMRSDIDRVDEVPTDEPPPQLLTDAEAAKVARLGTKVLVIDGRPRYHVAECLHLLGRDFAGGDQRGNIHRLPVLEAVELGFTPCGLCEPARELLAAPRS